MSKASPTLQRETSFLFVILPVLLILSGCAKRGPKEPPKNNATMLLNKTLDGVTVNIKECKPLRALREYKQLRVAITNTTDAPLRLSGSNITLPLTSASSLNKKARGYKTAYHWPNSLMFGAGLLFFWPLCLTSIATTGIGYQCSKVSDERMITKQSDCCLGREDIINIAPKSTSFVDLFIKSSYVPTFAITLWQDRKPLVFLARPPL